MKKFLVGVIFLIPIVVVIALSATGAIISLTTPVNPEEIVIKDSDNVEIEKNAIIKIDSRNYDEFIIIDVLPQITQDKSITYERVEEAGEGEVSLERIGESNRYQIIPKKVGVTKLEIRAKANVNAFIEVTFYVTSDSIEQINIYDESGAFLGADHDLIVGERFFVDVYPIDALRGDDIVWTSSNTNVAEVSANGTVTIKDRGLTRIKATAVDKDGNTVSDYVDVDTTKALVSSKKIYTTEVEITESYLKEHFALSEDVNVTCIEENKYSFSYGEISVEVELVTIEEGEWGFVDLPDVVYTRNAGYYPHVVYIQSGEIIEDVEIAVQDLTVIEIIAETGMLLPLKAGSTMVSATYNGKTVSKEVVVRENPIAFELELGAADQKLGIQLTRTWGQYFIDENNNLTDKFTFGLLDKANTYDVEWSLDDETKAEFTKIENSQDVELKFLEGVRGNSVTLTATLKVNNLLQTRVKRSFTFNVKEKNAINVYSWDEFKRAVEIGRHNVVLQSDVYPNNEIRWSASLYGNGFKMDASEFPVPESGHWRSMILDGTGYSHGHFEYLETGVGKTEIEDVVFIGNTEFWESEKVLEVMSFQWSFCPVEVKYCQISGFNGGLFFDNPQTVLVEGCIIGDNYQNGITLSYEPGRAEHCTVTIRNNIFKQTGGAAVQLVTSWFHENAMDKSFPLTIKIEGFMDVYNWKQRSEFKDIFATSILGLVGTDYIQGALREMFVDGIAKVINSFIKEPAYDHLFYKYQGKEYASFAIMGIGLIANADLNIVNTDDANDQIQKYTIALEDENGNPVGDLKSVSTLVGMVVSSSKPLHITNPCFLACADFENGEPEIKPGDPVPNSKELYEKLTSTM